MSLRVIDPGLATRVVDFGRPSSRSLGVPVGGAADRAALALGNALVGNSPDAPALEVCLKGPVLRAEVQIGCALYGAPFSMASARQTLAAGATFTIEPGEEIHIGGTSEGMRAYFCVRDGFQIPTILRSRSSLETVKAGDAFSCETSSLKRRSFPPSILPTITHQGVLRLRVLPGLQADWFDESQFYDQAFTVTPALDRMGIRLQGEPLALPERELVSEPVCPGAVQVTRDGQCIILGIDGQTIGGYPKIAQVIQADLDGLGQLRPGENLHFARIDLAEAIRLFHEREALLHEWILRARESIALIT